MNNRGYVTIFLSLMLVVMLVILTAVLKINDESAAKTKVATATSSVMSSELANYNRLIFDRYHILLLDKNAAGQGEGAIESDMEELLRINLGDSYTVNGVHMAGSVGLMDDELAEFKYQIRDNFKYEALEYTVDKLLEKTDGSDDPISDEDINDIDEDVSERQQAIEAESGTASEEETETSQQESEPEEQPSEVVVDPRDTLKNYTDAGIASILLPSDIALSERVVVGDDIPSKEYGGVSDTTSDIDSSFQDLDQMELDSEKGNGWGLGLITNMEAVMYGAECFNCLTEKKYDDTYLSLEMEYLIGGEDTDEGNYKKVVNRILLIRFGFNFAYILTDISKQEECETLATALTVEIPPAEPVVKYLLMGCWSYIESVADVYLLLRNHYVPFWKSSTTWVTDFESLANLEALEGEEAEEESGLNYKEYLMILMAFEGEDIYYRMLDLIQLNVSETDTPGKDPSFRIKNAITAFGTDVDVSYKGKEIFIHEDSGF